MILFYFGLDYKRPPAWHGCSSYRSQQKDRSKTASLLERENWNPDKPYVKLSVFRNYSVKMHTRSKCPDRYLTLRRLLMHTASTRPSLICFAATSMNVLLSFLGLARTMYLRCIYGISGREITKYTVTYVVCIRFWPTLLIFQETSEHNRKARMHSTCA
jgi:hypothetical protein